MKKLLLLPLLATILFSACTKNVYEGDQSPPTQTPYFSISGIRDISVVAGNQMMNYTLSLSVIYTTGAQERVALSLEGMPPKLGLSDSLPSGIPSFSAYTSLIDSGVAEGMHPITLVATSPSAGRRTYTFNYTVKSPPDCGNSIVGAAYNSYSSCLGGNYQMNITNGSGVHNRITLSNVDNAGLQLYADLNCNSQSLNIPNQVVGGATYYGYGQFQIYNSGGSIYRQVSFSYYKSAPGGNQSYCQVQMQL